MTRSFYVLLGICFFLGTCANAQKSFKHYGQVQVNEAQAISIEQMIKQFNQNPQSEEFTFYAPIVNVCQSAGCWVNVQKPEGELMRIRFKDHFGIPTKTEAGKVAYFHGLAYYDTISVELQKHFLEDGNAPQSEIDKIVAPKIELNFLADGVLIPSGSKSKKNK